LRGKLRSETTRAGFIAANSAGTPAPRALKFRIVAPY
jgi:hypothetical protein